MHGSNKREEKYKTTTSRNDIGYSDYDVAWHIVIYSGFIANGEYRQPSVLPTGVELGRCRIQGKNCRQRNRVGTSKEIANYLDICELLDERVQALARDE
jgi:hypothetical protein